jgi:cellulose synthase/poly-beta-1,6-N-acetylglucosamine synthase-like glycosyltransferase
VEGRLVVHTVLDTALVAAAVSYLTAVLVLALERPGRRWRGPVAPVVAGVLAAVVASWHAPLVLGVGCGVVALLTSVAYGWRARVLHPSGAALWASHVVMTAVAAPWGLVFLAGLHLSLVTTVLLWASVPLVAVSLPSALVQTREGWEPLLRRTWHRHGTVPAEPVPGARLPFVSIHVPCHAEPPELVKATLDRLAALDYPHFEVVVVDNNTADPALWRPVEAHCRRLGVRFRFLHIEGITGAKAGALNWSLPYSDPRTELVGVVDADYQVEPDWLSATVGHFADTQVAFVQCPHAYRDYEGSRLGRMANWEYTVFFAAGMVSLDEHGAGLTVGTMSLIRRTALEQVGGWAEWCLTEDSELAIRLHAAGYTSRYLTHAHGRGLIPETFRAYRQQRFRWTAGPVQELKHHWRLFVRSGHGAHRGQPNALTAAQRLHHGNHGLDVVLIGVRALAYPLAVAAGASLVAHHERVDVPFPLWLASTALLVTNLTMRALVYRRVVGATVGQALGGIVAFWSLSFVITLASLSSFAGRSIAWQRTTKFRPERGVRTALAGVRVETVLAMALLASAAAIAVTSSGGLAGMFALGLAAQGGVLATAPVMAVLADRDLHPRGVHRTMATTGVVTTTGAAVAVADREVGDLNSDAVRAS